MRRSRTQRFLVTSVTPDGVGRRPDQLIVEEPLTIQLDGTTVSTTMRTPGHDFELAVGFCHSEGLLHGHPVSEVRYCATGSAVETEFNVVTVSTDGLAPTPTPRLVTTSSSCGWCGSEQLSRLASGPTEPTPVGVFRASSRPEYAAAAAAQVAAAVSEAGDASIHDLLRSNPTWEVG